MELYILTGIYNDTVNGNRGTLKNDLEVKAIASDTSAQYQIISDNMKLSAFSMSTFDVDISYTGRAADVAEVGDFVFALGKHPQFFQITETQAEYERKIISLSCESYIDFLNNTKVAHERPEGSQAATFAGIMQYNIFGSVPVSMGIDETDGRQRQAVISVDSNITEGLNKLAEAFDMYWTFRYALGSSSNRRGIALNIIIDARSKFMMSTDGELLTVGDELHNFRVKRNDEGVNYECECTVDVELGAAYTLRDVEEGLTDTCICLELERSETAGTSRPTFGSALISRNAFEVMARNV